MKNNFYVIIIISIITMFFDSLPQSYASSTLTSPPGNIRIQQAENALLLTWKKPLQDIDGYRIYRSTSKKKIGKVLITINDAGINSFTDSSVKPNKKYYYTVRSFLDAGAESTNKKQVYKSVKKTSAMPPIQPSQSNYAQQTENDLPSIIKQWKPRVAFIECKVIFKGNNMGEQFGSAYLWGSDESNGNPILLTNNHVIDVAIHNLYGDPMGITATPTSCDIKISEDSQSVTVYNDKGTFSGFKEKDVGLVTIKNPTPYMEEVIQNLWYGSCNERAELGEEILILGYPGIGDKSDVTVTDGIISGYDGDYYITSAKVEHGNSGGIAISVKNNCYLGIPSFVETGSVESLARIFDFRNIFK